jgi:formate-dependent nitrite reductase cytochrome c552 subunit
MTSGPDSPDDTEQLKAQIEQTREHLGQTAEQLVARVDVKARAQAKVTDLTQRAIRTTSKLRRQAAVRADSARSQLTDKTQTPDSLKQAVTMGLDGARKYRIPVIIAVGLLVTGAAVLVRTRSRR